MAKRITAILGTAVDRHSGDIIIVVRQQRPGGKPLELQFERGMVPILIATLFGQMERSRKDFGDTADYQPATLTGFQKVMDPLGKPGLELKLDHGLPFVVLIDPSIMPALRNEIAELERLSKTPDKGTPTH